MQTIDNVLSHMNERDWMFNQKASPIMKIAHEFHMQQHWVEVKEEYAKVKKSPPTEEQCQCITDTKRNGVIDELMRMANIAMADEGLFAQYE